MKRIARILLLGLMLAALPMRGYAGALMLFCDSHDSTAAVAAEHEHEHQGDHHEEGSHGATICSLCAACCAGAGLVSETVQGPASASPDTGTIPFLARQVSEFVPDHLDRPPPVL